MPPLDPAPGTPADWLRHAHSDLRLAELASADPNVLPNQAAFHAQQAAEKALKAALVHCAVEFPKTHHLDELIELVRDAGVSWPFPADQVEALTPYAVQTRYPGVDDTLSGTRVHEAIALARQVVAWAMAACGRPPADNPPAD